MALSDYLPLLQGTGIETLNYLKLTRKRQENGAEHNHKPLVSPECLCNPPEGNNGVTEHSVLHRDPATEVISREQPPQLRNHISDAKHSKYLSSGIKQNLDKQKSF